MNAQMLGVFSIFCQYRLGEFCLKYVNGYLAIVSRAPHLGFLLAILGYGLLMIDWFG
jgi:hypothetical protein